MTVRWLTSALLFALLASASNAGAQQPDARCVDPTVVGVGLAGGDACQKAIDLFRYLTPQVGVMIQGGNATVGHGGTLGLGHFALALRATGVRADAPRLDGPGVAVGAPQRSDYEISTEWAALPSADLAIGIFEGIPLGLTRVGSLELLGSAFFVPDLRHESVRLATGGASFRLGWGARVGILQETIFTPALVVTWMRRETPGIDLAGATESDDSLGVRDLRIRTTGWRVVASKSFLTFGLAAGIGRDEYVSRGELFYDIAGAASGAELRVIERVRPYNAFANLSLSLFLLQLVGEAGRVWGSDVATFNSFATPADAARWYGSLGVRISR